MKKIRMFASIVFVIMISTGVCLAASGDYDHSITVEKMVFQWKLTEDAIHIHLEGKTEGWVGIGFNPSKEMKDANFVIGYVKKGKAKVTDHFGVTTRSHTADKKLGGKSNVSDISGSEAKGVTRVAFTIPLDSKDQKDTAIDPDKETMVLLAYGAGRDSFRAKHKFRTVLTVDLKTGKFEKVK